MTARLVLAKLGSCASPRAPTARSVPLASTATATLPWSRLLSRLRSPTPGLVLWALCEGCFWSRSHRRCLRFCSGVAGNCSLEAFFRCEVHGGGWMESFCNPLRLGELGV